MVLVLLIATFSLVTSNAYAASIGYSLLDLTDVNPGEDLWRYEYTVSGHTFLQSQFFDIYFDPVLYGALTAGPSPNPDWDILILQQPNPANLPPFDKGIFDAFALADSLSLFEIFSVNFVYRGAGTPGAQPFEVFDENSNRIESGFTTLLSDVPIPEPSTIWLSLIGLMVLRIPLVNRR